MDDGRGFGPPHERRGTARRVVVPYGWLRRAAAIALASGAQRSVCASGCEGGVGIDARTIPKGGPPPRPPRQRLAKRKARKEQLVKFDLCPITSECSTAYHVRKSAESPARVLIGITLTEQDRLGPRPAARQGALRARNCTATGIFFDGSTAVFFLGRQKENGGGLLQVTTCHHAPFGAAVGRHAESSCPTGATGDGAQQRGGIGASGRRGGGGGTPGRHALQSVEGGVEASGGAYGGSPGGKFFLFLPCAGEWGLL